MRIIAVANEKGGTGKTTTVMNLAAIAAEGGARVLVVDCDPQRSATWWAGNAGEQLPFDFADDATPANLSMLRNAPYDVIVVDTPGAREDSRAKALLAAVLDQVDFVVLPMEPAPLSVMPLLRMVKELVEPKGVPYRVLINRVDPRDKEPAEAALAMLTGNGVETFTSTVRQYKLHATAPLRGQVVTQYKQDQRTVKAIDDYRRVAVELFTRWPSDSTPDVINLVDVQVNV